LKSFSLFCSSQITIGLSWSASLSVKVKKTKIEVWFSSDNGEEPALIKEFNKKCDHRHILNWIYQDDVYNLEGDFVDQVFTNGLNEMWSDLYSLAWVKDEDVNSIESMLTFLELDEDQLKKLWRSKKEKGRSEFLNRSYKAVSKFKSRFGKDLRIEDMFKWADSKSNLDLVEEKLIEIGSEEEKIYEEKLIKEENIRFEKLQPFLKEIEFELEKWKKNNPYRGGIMNARLRDQKIKKFRNKLENHFLKHGRFPDQEID